MRFAAVALATLLLGAACGPELTEGQFDAQVPELVSEEISGELGDGAGRGTGSMDGQWVMIHENSACLTLGRSNEVLSYTYYVVDMEQDGRLVFEDRQICATDLSPVLQLRPLVPPDTLASVQFPSVDTGIVSTAGVGGSYSSPTEILLWGVELQDPVNEPLPRTADDPRVVDLNEDGNPGVTFEIEGSSCRRFIVQRTVSRYFGTFTTPNRIEGRSSTFTETRTVESTSAVCGVDIALVPNDPFSRFVMVRADGNNTTLDLRDETGRVTCDTLNAVRDQLYPTRSPIRENCPR